MSALLVCVALHSGAFIQTESNPLIVNLIQGKTSNFSNASNASKEIIISTEMTTPAKAGDTKIGVKISSGFQVGKKITIGKGTENEESHKLAGFGSLVLATPLANAHPPGSKIEQILAKGDSGPSQCTFRKVDGTCACPFGTACPPLPCPNMCSGHGDCIKGDCQCYTDWVDKDCSLLLECPGKLTRPGTITYCNGHGQCTKDPHESKKYCVCDDHWFGDACGVGPHYCGTDYQCKNGGTCGTSGTCDCDPQWTGYDCSIKMWSCPKGWYYSKEEPPKWMICSNYGQCVEGGICTCKNGHRGEACEYWNYTCPEDYKCGDHGSCVSGSCVCNDNWYGHDCSVAPVVCGVDFDCVHGHCVEWEVPIPIEASANQTSNQTTEQTTSQQTYMKKFCVCDDGWGGVACDRDEMTPREKLKGYFGKP